MSPAVVQLQYLTSMNSVLNFGLVACVGLAAAIDVRQRRIPNWLSLSGLLCGLCLNSIFEGRAGFILSLLGIATGFFLLFLDTCWVG